MKKNYSLALHIFRRDLRLEDNTALIAALKASEKVLPCFIFDERQIENNAYQSDNCIQFMAHSLAELADNLQKKNGHLYFFYGKSEEIVKKLLAHYPIKAVFFNRDYTPFSKLRDQAIKKYCDQHEIDYHVYADALLHEPEQVLKSDGTPYTIFTPFFRKASTLSVAAPEKNTHSNYADQAISFEDKKTLASLLKKSNPNLFVKGGRKEGLALLKNIKQLKNYADIRNIPALAGTTKLSAHNKFGTISIRELYTTIVGDFGKSHTLITEIHWRDFFTHIAFHYPQVFGHAFQKKFARLTWRHNEKHFQAWCEGTTGFPIVDAGMRELNTTGYMHNRVRMIVASFLTKDLHIDWRLGEKYFAQKLIDYDPAVNNGNWQWAASTGCDAQPYFRIFNPWLQQQKFDPDCLYIKRWIPALARASHQSIHQIYEMPLKHLSNYPPPLVDHAIESAKAKIMYKNQLTEG